MKKELSTVRIRWCGFHEDDEQWSYTCCLYAYIAPQRREILYIGKCDGCTVRQRWSTKENFWRDLENERRIRSHRIIVGELMLPLNLRLTRQLLSDVESLLICRVKPWGNIQCQNTRIERPGLGVTCTGAWPLSRKTFVDCT